MADNGEFVYILGGEDNPPAAPAPATKSTADDKPVDEARTTPQIGNEFVYILGESDKPSAQPALESAALEDDSEFDYVLPGAGDSSSADEVSTTANSGSVTLDADSTIAGALAWRDRLLTLLASKPERLRIDASSVERIDTAMLQVLCALQHCAQDQGARLEWVNVSAALRSATDLLGLSAQFEFDRAA